MAPLRKKALLISLIQHNRRYRRLINVRVAAAIARRRIMYKAYFLLLLLLIKQRNNQISYTGSCRRLPRCNKSCWWQIARTHTAITVLRRHLVFLKTHFILSYITHDLERQAISEEPVSPECRLAICLYRLGRGDYTYTIAEMVGLGQSTVTTITNEVNQAIVNNMWQNVSPPIYQQQKHNSSKKS